MCCGYLNVYEYVFMSQKKYQEFFSRYLGEYKAKTITEEKVTQLQRSEYIRGKT